jgi:AcrR family transcriptional regulator
MPKRAPMFYAPPSAGGGRARGRTFRLLMAEALALVRKGRIPSVAEVAQSAGVSRATAYRYFPTRGKVIGALVAQALAPVREYVPREGDDGLARLNVLIDKTYPRFRKYEPHMRAALQLALEHKALERAGLLEEEPFRRGQRREILKLATEPLRRKLPEKDYFRLLNALAVVYGIEPFIVLKDICGASERETEATVRWMCEALVAHALRAPPAARPARRPRPDRRR